MNQRETPQLSAGVRRALRCLSLLLVPAMTLEQGHAGPRVRSTIRPSAQPVPYLPVLGSPSLRFEEALPPPDLVTRPAAAAPPVPALTPTESTVAAANVTAARSTTTPPPEEPVIESKPPTPVVVNTPETKTPAPILPDSARPVVHAEDFLPYFQIPSNARQPGDINVFTPGVSSAPSPAPIPPSSATYTQPSR